MRRELGSSVPCGFAFHVSRFAKPRRAGAAGFTLVELIVTVGIMALLLSITVVAFGSALKASGLRNANHTVHTTLDGARIRAIQQRRQVRFEAQRVPNTLKDQWQVSSNAGDLNQEWKRLPEFVKVETNVTAPTDDRMKSSGCGGNYEPNIERISVTFGPDGSVVRCVLGETGGAVRDAIEPDAPFALRFEGTRDSDRSGAERPHCWVAIFPLTGNLESYGVGHKHREVWWGLQWGAP